MPRAVVPGPGPAAMVVDSQLHVWNPETPETPWRQGWARYAPLPSLPVDDVLAAMTAAGVDRGVLIPADWDRRGSELVGSAAREHPNRFCAFGTFSIGQPMDGEQLRQRCAEMGLTGVRQVFLPAAGASVIEDVTSAWLWEALEAAQLPAMVWMPEQFNQLQRVVEHFPGVRLAVDHLNMPMKLSSVEMVASARQLCTLADHLNLAVKLSALPCLVDERYPFGSLGPIIREVVDAFGAERVFWGSDLQRLPCTYRQSVEMLGELGVLSGKEERMVLGEALLQWLDWPAAADEGTPLQPPAY